MVLARPSSVDHSRAKAPTGTSPNAQDKVPSPSTSTPFPSGATPRRVQTSPQTPKSPKAPSVAVAPTSIPAAEPASSPAQAAPSPVESSLKRSQVDEPTDQAGPALPSGTAAGETPSKRIKTDWENVPDVEPFERQAEAESVKTRGQAAQFYNDMLQILEMSNDTALPPELHDALAQTVDHDLEVPDATGSSFLDFTAFRESRYSRTRANVLYKRDPAGSETVAPPAPATSGFVGDRAKIVDPSESEPKTDLFDMGADPLRLGIWGEIDGGKSDYFDVSDMWNWDSIPPSSGFLCDFFTVFVSFLSLS
ncbi:hypothetical protein A7U60_g8302 [Sanghuangporus baumii]|uniref:Uncharacterized protein n=1 Tax=Sanghuangporus baumii TaxID=108892 RepID=A0A9Q5HRQ4_SANBA|nr:hypothetical protein A7U60_g8302 [Sanghuangporus baumii]